MYVGLCWRKASFMLVRRGPRRQRENKSPASAVEIIIMSASPEGELYLLPIINRLLTVIRGPHVHTLIKGVTQVGMNSLICFNGHQTLLVRSGSKDILHLGSTSPPSYVVVMLRCDHIKTTRLQRIMAEIGQY